MAKKIVLWGHTTVGKTTLLAMYLEYEINHRKAWIDDLKIEHVEQLNLFNRKIQRLKLHHNIAPTVNTFESTYHFPTRSGEELIFIDIKGGSSNLIDVKDNEKEIIYNAIEEADGILFICDWPTSVNRVLTQQAIQNVLPLFGNRPKGLVISKAEQHIEEEDPLWDGGLGWLRLDPNWNNFISEFGNNFWPVTTFGYYKPTDESADGLVGHPACIMNEFGEILPYFIGRDEKFVYEKVSRPFEAILGDERIGVIPK